MKWLVDTMGIDELRDASSRSASSCVASPTWPGGIPAARRRAAATRPPASPPAIDPDRPDRRAGRRCCSTEPVRALGEGQRRARRRPRAPISAIGVRPARRHHRRPVPRRSPHIQRDFALDVRVTNRQNFALRDLTEADLRRALRPARATSAWPSRAPSSPATSSPAPGADTCNLAVTQSPRPRRRDRRRARGGRPRRGPRRPHQHLRLHEQLRPAPHLRHRLLRASSAGPTAAPHPATRCCSAATSATRR